MTLAEFLREDVPDCDSCGRTMYDTRNGLMAEIRAGRAPVQIDEHPVLYSLWNFGGYLRFWNWGRNWQQANELVRELDRCLECQVTDGDTG